MYSVIKKTYIGKRHKDALKKIMKFVLIKKGIKSDRWYEKLKI
jgi:hypothetical protein